jgi:hypothetical protein
MAVTEKPTKFEKPILEKSGLREKRIMANPPMPMDHLSQLRLGRERQTAVTAVSNRKQGGIFGCRHFSHTASVRINLLDHEGAMTNEELLKALRELWEKHDGKIIEIKEGEPTFDAKDFIESLSYSNSKIQD